jgi:conserved oligomeric Golgi complex subunit 5
MEVSREAGNEAGEQRRKNSVTNQSSSIQAAASLALLLREDPLLTRFDLNVSGNGEEACFAYAAALLEAEDSRDHQQRAEEALGEVDRKLALVESLGERVSRTSPEAVAGHILRLHGYSIEKEEKEGEEFAPVSSVVSGATTLVATRERCDRLKRQGEVLEGVANRVESSLQRGLTRIEKATKRLSRVLKLSATLKMILRLQFESSKLQGYDLEDLRDLTRAAASVAVVEDLLSKPELKEGPPIEVVQAIRPQARTTAAAVRRAAAALLAQHHENTTSSSSAVVQLGATLQVYYHLGELPQAAWSAVDHALAAAEKASNTFWSPATLSRLIETANTEAKIAAGAGGKKNANSSDTTFQRALKKKLREMRAEAAATWASGIADASLQVWNLQRVLCRKSDPVSRQVFIDVVSAAPIPKKFEPRNKTNKGEFSIFSLYWEKLCHSLGDRLKYILESENGKLCADASALYPAVRAATIGILGNLHDTMQAGQGGTNLEDATTTSAASGLLGGSAALDDSFLQWSTVALANAAVGFGGASADLWTKPQNGGNEDASSSDRFIAGDSTASMSVIFQSNEWVQLQGNHASGRGLFRLQQAFLEEAMQRLCAPLEYMFPENITLDADGHAISGLPLLPSRYDIQKFDVNIRQELSLADPREGGGDLSAVTMIAEIVVSMVSQFCDQAKGAVSQIGEDSCLNPNDGSPTNALTHDMKVAAIMSAMATSVRTAPEKVFLAPYRPAVTAKLEEAVSMCERALQPALQEIESFVKVLILAPLCRALNRRVAWVIGKMHLGSYMHEGAGGLDDDSPTFVQKYLADMYDNMAGKVLARLPTEFASIVASTVARFSIYTFVSNASLIRPLSESARLHVTQDLADFELALEQFVLKSGGSMSLSQISNGRPYMELRAVRQMLFWSDLDDKSKLPADVVKSILREVWVKEVRPSTVFHYLFSFAPSLLSSPHHAKRMKVEDYVVGTLVKLDGDVEDGEATAWMTTMACCDSYQQRESAQHGFTDGDSRIPAILMALGPELLRRRRPN